MKDTVRNLAIVEAYKSGMSMADIGRKHRLTRARVLQVVKESGEWKPMPPAVKKLLDIEVAGVRVKNNRLKKVSINENGCWIYQGGRDKDGRAKAGDRYMNRVFYQYVHPEINLEGLFLISRCCVPGCVNPEHYLLTKNRIYTRIYGKHFDRSFFPIPE